MATKHDSECLLKAGDDEPIFVIRAHDLCGPTAVRRWAIEASNAGAPLSKIQNAYAIADDMEAWQRANGSKVPD